MYTVSTQSKTIMTLNCSQPPLGVLKKVRLKVVLAVETDKVLWEGLIWIRPRKWLVWESVKLSDKVKKQDLQNQKEIIFLPITIEILLIRILSLESQKDI